MPYPLWDSNSPRPFPHNPLGKCLAFSKHTMLHTSSCTTTAVGFVDLLRDFPQHFLRPREHIYLAIVLPPSAAFQTFPDVTVCLQYVSQGEVVSSVSGSSMRAFPRFSDLVALVITGELPNYVRKSKCRCELCPDSCIRI